MRTAPGRGLVEKMITLVKRAGIEKIDFNDKFTAIKIHFGEPGNLGYIRPNFAAGLADFLRNMGAKPYLTDSNTLYSGGRSNGYDHFNSAMENGFNPISSKCPVFIADGIKGTDYREVKINGEYCKAPKIGAAIADADIVISMNHFKGHEQAGFGGALKNLGMGSASVGGKLELHSASKPYINKENCRGCGLCAKNCAHSAITIVNHKAEIDQSKCVGCGQCIAVCQFDAATVSSYDTSEHLNCKIAEYAKAVVLDKPNFHISFIMNVSPECDCWNHNDASIVPDLGIAASFDPVALDCACADLVNSAPEIRFEQNEAGVHFGNMLIEKEETAKDKHEHNHDSSCNDHNSRCSHDKFHVLHPDTDWKTGTVHAEKIGIGKQDYELVVV